MREPVNYRYTGKIHPHLTGRPWAKDSTVPQPAKRPVQSRTVIQLPPVNGSRQWAALHARALSVEAFQSISYDGKPVVMDTTWLTDFRMMVPCGECRKHWDGMLIRTPPDWLNYFAWTVDRHNEVNARLGKPLMSVEDARAICLSAGQKKGAGDVTPSPL